MRKEVKKFLFVGAEREKEQFFRQAQEVSLIHFIESGESSKHLPRDIQNTISAIKVLRGLPQEAQEEPENISEADRLTKEILDLKTRLDKLNEEQRVLKLEIARIEVFGDFSFDDIEYIQKNGKRYTQFFFMKHSAIQEEGLPKELFFVATDHGLDYFVSFSEEPLQIENMIEMRFDESLGSLQKRESEVETEIDEIEEKLKTYSKYNTFLHHSLTHKYNDHDRRTAREHSVPVLDDGLFTVMGWVPEDRVDELESLTQNLDLFYDEIAIEEDDLAPTYLENEGPNRIGEDLVHIYDTPSNTDRDPSLWVLCSFALFFSIIIADGGYGLLFLLTALYFRFKTKKITTVGKRVFNLGLILFTSCIIWGVASNSFFGMNFAVDSPVRKVSLVNWLAKKKASYHIAKQDATHQEWVEKYPDLSGVTDPEEYFHIGSKVVEGKNVTEVLDKFTDNVMMELALLIGMIHISLSFARYLDRNWAGLGWIFVIIGGYLYIPEYLDATSMLHYVGGIDKEFAGREGYRMMIGGLGLAVGLAMIKDKLFGLLEVMNVIQVFADILSYLRLYALGLAGSIISATINDIAGSVFLFAGIILIIIGHIVNMVLSIIGDVIHGLRLNFIEWYHYSFEGGGKNFNPLRKVEIE